MYKETEENLPLSERLKKGMPISAEEAEEIWGTNSYSKHLKDKAKEETEARLKSGQTGDFRDKP